MNALFSLQITTSVLIAELLIPYHKWFNGRRNLTTRQAMTSSHGTLETTLQAPVLLPGVHGCEMNWHPCYFQTA